MWLFFLNQYSILLFKFIPSCLLTSKAQLSFKADRCGGEKYSDHPKGFSSPLTFLICLQNSESLLPEDSTGDEPLSYPTGVLGWKKIEDHWSKAFIESGLWGQRCLSDVCVKGSVPPEGYCLPDITFTSHSSPASLTTDNQQLSFLMVWFKILCYWHWSFLFHSIFYVLSASKLP